MDDFNPKNPKIFWDHSLIFTRAEIITKALGRKNPQFTLNIDRLRIQTWESLTEPQREFLLCGMYNGIDCDNCGTYIPDVPDAQNRLCVGQGDSTICAVCMDLETQALHDDPPTLDTPGDHGPGSYYEYGDPD